MPAQRGDLAVRELRHSAPLFAAMGDRTRLRLLVQLTAYGPLSTTQLAARSILTRQAVSKHLTVLSTAELVSSRRLGRERLWQVNGSKLEESRACLETLCQHQGHTSRSR